jgi:phenol 2-monooxygenase (NADPH)
LVLKGYSDPSLLATYTEERLPVARQLIKYDIDVSALMSCRIPEGYAPDRDVNEVLGEIFAGAKGFNTGLGIEYPANGSITSSPTALSSVNPGQRAPDIKIMTPGSGDIVRLVSQMQNLGGFYVLVFGGLPFPKSNASIALLHDYVLSSKFKKHPDLFSFITLSLFNPPKTYNIYETLNGEGIGRTYFDTDGSGHERYGIAKDTPEAVVLLVRPDGWTGWVGSASSVIKGELETFLQRFIKV